MKFAIKMEVRDETLSRQLYENQGTRRSLGKKIGGKHGNDGFVTEFDFYETFFEAERHYKVLRFEGYSDQWLDFVIMNRDESHKDYHSFGSLLQLNLDSIF